MKDQYKTKKQLIDELEVLHSQLVGPKKTEANRKREEEALLESEETFKALAENANDGILITVGEGIQAYANRRAGEITGYSVAELLKSGIKDLVHPDELQKIMERYKKRLSGKPAPPQYETVIINKEGKNVPTELTASKTVWQGQPANLVIFRDITERKRAEETLKESESRFRNIMESSKDGIIFFDGKTRKILFGNGAMAELLGCSKEDLVGRSIPSLHPSEEWASIEQEFQKHVSGELSVSTGIPVLRNDGSVFYADVSSSLITLYGRTYFSAFFRDITDRKQSEEALRESEERYRRLVDNSLMGIGISRGDQVVFANPALLRLFGYDDLEEFTKIPLLNHVAPASHELIVARMEKVAQGEPVPVEFEYDILGKDGLTKTLLASSQHFTLGGKTYSQTIFQDITERKRAEETLRESEERFRLAFENANTGMCLVDLEGNLTRVNNKMCEIFGYTKEELERMTVNDIAHPEDIDKSPEFIQETLQGKIDRGTFEKRYFHNKGQVVTCQVSSSLVRNAEGSPLYFISHIHDITERKRAEEALHQANEMLRAMLEAAPVPIFDIDTEGWVQNVWNPAAERLLGWSRQEVLGRFLPSVPEEAREEFRKFREWIRLGKSMVAVDVRRQRKDGSPIDYSIYAAPLYDAQGQVTGNIAVLVDMTERKRAEERLKESEAKYRNLVENSLEGISLSKGDQLFFANQALLNMAGYETAEEFLHVPLLEHIAPESKDLIRGILKKQQNGKPVPARLSFKIVRKDGDIRDLEASFAEALVEGESWIQSTFRDVTDQRRAEEALRESEEKYRELVENINDILYATDENGIITYIAPAIESLSGYTTSEIIGRSFSEFVYQKDVPYIMEKFQQDVSGHTEPHEYRMVTKSGVVRWVRTSSRPFFRETRAVGLRGVMTDVTERRRAEEESEALREQLRQSQKMEAIGRLAGGIAHDFNNLLTIIKGYSQLSLIELKEDSPLKGNIEQIHRATDRAADLVRQLLAFSRRQILDMKVLDLNSLLKNLDKMLRRIIGEDIELVTLLGEDLGRVKTDPGQIEQVVMNLAVNAKDAMPKGGRLIIETANVELDEAYAHAHVAVTPGRYVMIAVSDTGAGMGPEVRDRVFEPFFSTKEKDKGTGLGLSTVYGIAKQSGGNIWVYSEPGKGATFKIYLPRVDEAPEERREKVSGDELLGGSETILLVEDEENVRKLALRVLERQGYKVLTARDGDEALLVCEQHKDPIHLMLTDVVMPGMSGHELAKRLKSLRPKMKVLYMSGYTDNTIVLHGVLVEGVNYIQKPFTVDALTKKVREVLEQ